MGRGGRSRTQRKHFKQNRENVWKRTKLENNSNNTSWEAVALQNSSFEHYYKEQAIIAPEEWDAFMDTLRKPLPAAFRINASSQFSSDIRSQLQNDFMKSLQAEVTDKDEVEAIRPLPWYPDNFAWHLNFSRNQLRKNQTLERFHEFLKLENEVGSITRQEAVSMVPPLFLDVHPSHFVLDMCAAPGSKTFQLLEIIHQSSESGSLTGGLVVANDLDVQRCNLLIHQTKRMCTANLIVTNHEAQQFPGCRFSKHGSRTSQEGNGGQLSINQLLFDRVLCDVPCSGDGTLRKAPDIWRKWNPAMGNGVHSLQVQIAMRGLSLLKVGGRMVYSTCSMNPVENEAVVAEILRKCGESVELLDVSSELPQLVRWPGIKKWKVYDKGAWLASSKDVSKYRRNAVIPSMFPSGRSSVVENESDHIMLENAGNEKPDDCPQQMGDVMDQVSSMVEEVSDQPLERCMRIMPHDQNTGAFFIAVLHKRSPLPVVQKCSISQQGTQGNDESCEEKVDQTMDNSNAAEAVRGDCAEDKLPEAASDEGGIHNENEGTVALKPDASDATMELNSEGTKEIADVKPPPTKITGKRKLQIQGKWRGVDPVILFEDENIINSIKAFYGIEDSFPFTGHLVTRNNDTNSVKRIYYISKSVKDILELNIRVGQQLKIASVGLKMFERQTSKEAKSAPCSFRISSEGLPLILPYITKQILSSSPTDFKHLLQYKSIKFSDFSDSDFAEKASKLLPGCCVIVLGSKALSDPIHVDKSTIAIGCWKGRASLNVLVTAMDCRELLERLSVCTEYENPSLPDETISSEIQMNQVQQFERTLEN